MMKKETTDIYLSKTSPVVGISTRAASRRRVFPLCIAVFAVLMTLPGCGRTPAPESSSTTGPPKSTPPSAPEVGMGTPADPNSLPLSAFSVKWVKHTVPSHVPSNKTIPVTIRIQNASNQAWPNYSPTESGSKAEYKVRLGYRWTTGAPPRSSEGYAETRVELPSRLEPGQEVDIPVPLKTPAKAGEYQLQFDLVQELIAWFGGKGSPRLTIPVSVEATR